MPEHSLIQKSIKIISIVKRLLQPNLQQKHIFQFSTLPLHKIKSNCN